MVSELIRHSLLVAYFILLCIGELSMESNIAVGNHSSPVQRTCIGRFDNSSSTAGTVRLSLCNIGNFAYAVYVMIGLPGYGVWLEIDTGSSDTWVMTSQCTSHTCKLRKRYEPEKMSRTVKYENGNFSITYGQGVLVSGRLISDRVCFSKSLCFSKVIGAASHVTQNGMYSDGVLGLGFGSLSRFTGHRQNSSTNFSLTDIFGLKIRRESFVTQQSDNNGGELTLGYADPPPGPGIRLPVVQENPGYWMVNIQNMDFVYNRLNTGQERISLLTTGSAGHKAILDTGSTCLLSSAQTLPSQLNRWKKQGLVSLLGEHVVTDCKKLSSLPDLQFVFCDGRNCTRVLLTSEQYTIQFDPLDSCRRRVCIQHVPGLPFTVLGATFISNFYTIFNYKEKYVRLFPQEDYKDRLMHQDIGVVKETRTLNLMRGEDSINQLLCLVTVIAIFLLAPL